MTKSNYNRLEGRSGDDRFEQESFVNGKNFSADHGGIAELEKPASRAGLSDRDESVLGTSATFRMLPQRFKQGSMKLLWAGVSGGLGAFLLAEVPNTPGLALNLAIIGGIGLIAGAVMAALAFRDFTGRLIVDSQGVALTPRWAGFKLAWKQVSSWQVTDEDELPPQMQQLKLWRKGESTPIIVDTSWLCVESRGTLRKILRQVAGEDRLG
ncbi:MAG: hypothetical protein K8U03_00715 [Planctomycetia bacterium]|nr:hypothetical protein [Planctomycetia bacterium]